MIADIHHVSSFSMPFYCIEKQEEIPPRKACNSARNFDIKKALMLSV